MTDYLVLIPDSEEEWEAKTDEQRQAVFAQHRAFHEALAERGHRVASTAELTPASAAVTIRPGPEGPVITEGPYAESAEQVSGFYLIESDDRDSLVECLAILATAERGLELRECRDGSSS